MKWERREIIIFPNEQEGETAFERQGKRGIIRWNPSVKERTGPDKVSNKILYNISYEGDDLDPFEESVVISEIADSMKRAAIEETTGNEARIKTIKEIGCRILAVNASCNQVSAANLLCKYIIKDWRFYFRELKHIASAVDGLCRDVYLMTQDSEALWTPDVTWKPDDFLNAPTWLLSRIAAANKRDRER